LHQLETSILNVFCFVIDTTSALVILGYCAVAFVTAIRSRAAAEAHGIVARGAILGMSIKLVGATLKTIELQTWNQIGLFAAILLLRTVLKKVFQLENKIAARKEPANS
jgi:uncharacterized membrane protein